MASTATNNGMLPELSEQDAVGDIARIYREIRETCAVPYVSSLQRHLATRPGWLEWSWAAVRPAFVSGIAQGAAWSAAQEVDVEPLPRLSRAAMRVFGVDEEGERAIRAISDTFVRASPTNLMLSGLLRTLLEGHRPAASESLTLKDWTPPRALPSLPPLCDPNELGTEERSILMQFGTEVAGQPFVPGLYRMLGHWPVYMAHLAAVLVPRFEDAATRASCADVLQRIDATVPGIFAALPELGSTPQPPKSEFGDVIAALDRYRQTSPEMIVFGRLIRDALPDTENKESKL
jgi:hypothetical protein